MKTIIPLAVVAAALGAGCTTTPRPAQPAGYVTAVGRVLHDSAENGRPIVLRGVHAGGWLVTENWMCPNKVAGTQTETYESFVARFGKARADELYRIYRRGWWTERDFRNFADLGLNAIRLPFGWRDLITEDGEILPEGFALLDWFVDGAARAGIYTILDLHGAPGSQNGRDHSGETRFAKRESHPHVGPATVSVFASTGASQSARPSRIFAALTGLRWSLSDLYSALRSSQRLHPSPPRPLTMRSPPNAPNAATAAKVNIKFFMVITLCQKSCR